MVFVGDDNVYTHFKKRVKEGKFNIYDYNVNPVTYNSSPTIKNGLTIAEVELPPKLGLNVCNRKIFLRNTLYESIGLKKTKSAVYRCLRWPTQIGSLSKLEDFDSPPFWLGML